MAEEATRRDSPRLDYNSCLALLGERLAEPAPGRVLLLTGPRQIGKTTAVLELAKRLGPRAVYAAADAPEALLPGYWERLLSRAEQAASEHGAATLFLDGAHALNEWVTRLKAASDLFHREAIPVHLVATGSSAWRLDPGSSESLAGRFERITMAHWPAAALARAFGLTPREAAEHVVTHGSYPGAIPLQSDPAWWAAYVSDAILEPALGRDLPALRSIRRPALLREVLGVAVAAPARVVSLQKIQSRLQDAAAIETVAHYLSLLEEASLVAALPKYSARGSRRRAAPPKLVVLNNALLAATRNTESGDIRNDPERLGAWIENACLAHAWNAGQEVGYWREEPLDVDAVFQGSWGNWAVEIETRDLQAGDLRGLLEFVRRHPRFRPLVIGSEEGAARAARWGLAAATWTDFLLSGPPASD